MRTCQGLCSALLLIGIGLHAQALAQEQTPNERLMRLFNGIDADKDGYISRDEYMAVQAHRFVQLDRNKDGTLSRAEVMRAEGGGDEKDPRARAARDARFRAVDNDGDGKVTRSEYDAFAARIVAERDQDKDNRLSPQEFSSLWSGARGPRS
jgi:Ca2+-binding EF-hand superfamily protein